MRDTYFNWIFGRNSLYILLGIYVAFWLFFSFYPQSPYLYTWADYFVGCFVIGPMNTIFPYFYANFL
jgi:hypothetical protein